MFASKKQDLPRISTDLGMLIAFDEHLEKHSSSSCNKCDSDSNAMVSKFASQKHDLPKTATDRGMQIDLNEHNKKDDSSICDNCDSASKVNA
jgi:hypothetical protein